jgi:hypothetical protein
MALNELGNANASNGVAFLVAAGIVYEIIAAACSSPQTMEINAAARSDTLMKYVVIGEAQAAFFVGAAAVFDKKHAKPILAGGILAGVTMHLLYVHAQKSGLANPGPSTEDYSGGSNGA